MRWCRIVVLGADGSARTRRVLAGAGRPDLGTIQEIAQLGLLAKRLGGRLVLEDVTPELGELLDLAGLAVEMQRQPELGEQPLGVEEGEEEGLSDDLAP
jgi:hypothetical protein